MKQQIVSRYNSAKVLFECPSSAQGRGGSMNAPQAPQPLSDRELMRVYWKHFARQNVKGLTYTRWKDGIDIDVPTINLRQFADEIAAIARATGA